MSFLTFNYNALNIPKSLCLTSMQYSLMANLRLHFRYILEEQVFDYCPKDIDT